MVIAIRNRDRIRKIEGFREGIGRIHTSGSKTDEQGKEKVAQTWTRKF